MERKNIKTKPQDMLDKIFEESYEGDRMDVEQARQEKLSSSELFDNEFYSRNGNFKLYDQSTAPATVLSPKSSHSEPRVSPKESYFMSSM